MIEKSNTIIGKYEINCFVDTFLVLKLKTIKGLNKCFQKENDKKSTDIQENIEKCLDNQ